MVVVSKKPVTQVQDLTRPSALAKEIATLIDEIGAMLPSVEATQKQIKTLQNQLQPYADRMKALVTLISGLEDHAADETFKLEGAAFIADVGKRCVVRTVINPALAVKLMNKVEKGVGWGVVTVPLGKLDLHLSPAEKNRVLTVARGDRSVTIAKKATANVPGGII